MVSSNLVNPIRQCTPSSKIITSSNFLSKLPVHKSQWHLCFIHYCKCPRVSNRLFNPFWPNVFLFMLLLLKILSRMTNTVELDQTAPSGQSDQSLHCLHMPF